MIRPNHISATIIVRLVAFFSVVLYNAIDDRRATQTEKNIDHNDYVIKTQRIFTVRTKEMWNKMLEEEKQKELKKIKNYSYLELLNYKYSHQ